MNEEKLIFYTGAPGSKWSAVAHLITKSTKYSFNTSDYSSERIFLHKKHKTAHHGCYWGPGNEYGKNFHLLDTLSKDEILSEIDKPYSDKNRDQYRLIKCHHFSLHLDFIKTTFPKSKILIVLRTDQLCESGWLSAGGFESISYPNYSTYYKNKEILRERIHEENQSSKKFIFENNLELCGINEKYWIDKWGVTRSTKEIDIYMKSLEKNLYEKFTMDTMISCYNFDKNS